VVGTPPRGPDSVRWTASINMVWPGGIGTPLHFFLDDIAGATLIAGFAWSQGRKPGDPTSVGMTQNPFGNVPGAQAPPPTPGNEPGMRVGSSAQVCARTGSCR
jgi:hypothetical protein